MTASERYLALTPSQRGDGRQIAPCLTSLAPEAGDPSLAPALRKKLVARLLDDLATQTWDDQTSLLGLQALKLLGRVASGSEDIGSDKGIRTLLKHAGLLPQPPKPPKTASDNILESLRCLCNILRLSEPARDAFEAVGGAVSSTLVYLTDPAPPSLHFLAARILFLLTVKGGEVNRLLVESLSLSERLAETLQAALGRLKQDLPASEAPHRQAALSEHLKLLFNIAIFYPRLLAIDPRPSPYPQMSPKMSRRSSPTSNTSSPLLAFTDRPPSRAGSPRIGSPDDENGNRVAALGRKGAGAIKGLFGRSKSSSRPGSPDPGAPLKSAPVQEASDNPLSIRGFDSLTSTLVQLVLSLPLSPNDHLPLPPLSHAIHALSEFPLTDVWTSSANALPLPSPLPSTSASDPSGDNAPPLAPLPSRLLSFLDHATAYYCPQDPDGPDVIAKLDPNGEVDVDSGLATMLLLLRKIVVGEKDGATGRALRYRLLAHDIDRHRPLEKRDDLTGRLVRLMGAVYLSNTKVGASELLYALCDQDPSALSAAIGWGNAAGFLASNNLSIPPTASSSTYSPHSNSDGRAVNPVTGAFYDEQAVDEELAKMTPEEKQREAERLFVLFDRLEKTGVVKMGSNPVQQAREEGRLEELPDVDSRDDEEREEREALEDLRRYKERKAASRAT